jgi:hypothetical protein
MVEARREGPKPLNIVIKLSKNKTNQTTKATVEKVFSEHQKTRFLLLHKESTIPRWSHYYNPIIYKINW